MTFLTTPEVDALLAAPDQSRWEGRRDRMTTGKLFYRIRDRKRWIEFLDLLKVLRAHWPGKKLYLVCDNFSPHRPRPSPRLVRRQRGRVGVPDHLRLLVELDRERVRRPALLRPQRHRPPSHDEQNAAIAAYVRWGNARAEPKVNFAVDSPIRTWTSYAVKAA